MTDTIEPMADRIDQQQLAQQLVAAASTWTASMTSCCRWPPAA
jgi:hypothetical protein